MSPLNTAALLPIAAMVGLTSVVAGAMLAQHAWPVLSGVPLQKQLVRAQAGR